MKIHFNLLLIAILISSCAKLTELIGEMKLWHKTTLTFTGPESGEKATPNPFAGYWLNVTFSQGDRSFVGPGYFAADGIAWPDKTELWNRSFLKCWF